MSLQNIHMPCVERMTLVMQDWYGSKKAWQCGTYTTSMSERENVMYTVHIHTILTILTIRNKRVSKKRKRSNQQHFERMRIDYNFNNKIMRQC